MVCFVRWQNAAAFYFFACSKYVVRKVYDLKDNKAMTMKHTVQAAGLSGCMALFVETPVDLLKVKMQNQLYGSPLVKHKDTTVHTHIHIHARTHTLTRTHIHTHLLSFSVENPNIGACLMLPTKSPEHEV